MSHFTCVKTELKDREILLESLELLGERPNVPYTGYGHHEGTSIVELVITNPDHAEDHPTVEVDIAIGVDVGFKFNEETGSFEFYSDHATWEKDIPVERFLEKLTQQYARMMIHSQIKQEGWQVEEEWEMDDNSIELTVTRWVN